MAGFQYTLAHGLQGVTNPPLEQPARMMGREIKLAGQRALGAQNLAVRPSGVQPSYLHTPHDAQMQPTQSQIRNFGGGTVAFYIDQYNRPVQVPPGTSTAQIQQAGLTPVCTQPQRVVLPHNIHSQAAQLQQYLFTQQQQQQQAGIRPPARSMNQSPVVRPNMQVQMGQLQPPLRRPSLIMNRSPSPLPPSQPHSTMPRPMQSMSQPLGATVSAEAPMEPMPTSQLPRPTLIPGLKLEEAVQQPHESIAPPLLPEPPIADVPAPHLQFRVNTKFEVLEKMVAAMRQQIAAAEGQLRDVSDQEQKAKALLEGRRGEELDERLKTFNQLIKEYLTARGATASAEAFDAFIRLETNTARVTASRQATNTSDGPTLVDGELGQISLSTSTRSPEEDAIFTPKENFPSGSEVAAKPGAAEDGTLHPNASQPQSTKQSTSTSEAQRVGQPNFGSLFDWWLLFDDARRLQQQGHISDKMEIIPVGERSSATGNPPHATSITANGLDTLSVGDPSQSVPRTGSRPNSAARNNPSELPFAATIAAADEVRRAQRAHIDAHNRETNTRHGSASHRSQHVPQPLFLAGTNVQLTNGQVVAATPDLWRQYMTTGMIQSEAHPDSSFLAQPTGVFSGVTEDGVSQSSQAPALSPKSSARLRLPHSAQASSTDQSPMLNGSAKRQSQDPSAVSAKRPRTAQLSDGQQKVGQKGAQQTLMAADGTFSGTGLPVNEVDMQHMQMIYSQQLAAAARVSLTKAAGGVEDAAITSPFMQTPHPMPPQVPMTATPASPSSVPSAKGRGKKIHPPLSIDTCVPGSESQPPSAGSGRKRGGGRKRGPNSAKSKGSGSGGRTASRPATATSQNTGFMAWTNDPAAYSPIAPKGRLDPFPLLTESDPSARQHTSSSSENSGDGPHTATPSSFSHHPLHATGSGSGSSELSESGPPAAAKVTATAYTQAAPQGSVPHPFADSQVPAPQGTELDAAGLHDLLGSIDAQLGDHSGLGMLNGDGEFDFDWSSFAAAGAGEGGEWTNTGVGEEFDV